MKASKVALDPTLAQRLLEELIYERVMTQVDLLELSTFERELDDSIERLMAELDGHDDDPGSDVLASVLIDRALERVGDGYRELRTIATDPNWSPRRGRAARM